MPAQHGVRLNDRDGAPQRRKQSAQPNEKQPVGGCQPRPRGSLSAKHVQLMPQHRNLGLQLRLRPERRGQHVHKQPEEVEHQAYPSLSRRMIQCGSGFQ
jgi:hypothetical protein